MAQDRARGVEVEEGPAEAPTGFHAWIATRRPGSASSCGRCTTSLLQQPVPDRFIEFLETLDAAEKEEADEH